MTQSSVRYLGSRELHRELPRILDELNDSTSRFVLTIHAKPKAVMIGADAFAELVRQVGELDRKLGEELSGMMQSTNGKVASEKMKSRNGERSAARKNGKKLPKTRRLVKEKTAS